MNILVADLGGTKARLAWANESLELTSVSEYLTQNYSGFYAILDAFLQQSSKSHKLFPLVLQVQFSVIPYICQILDGPLIGWICSAPLG
jgi:glucokinase